MDRTTRRTGAADDGILLGAQARASRAACLSRIVSALAIAGSASAMACSSSGDEGSAGASDLVAGGPDATCTQEVGQVAAKELVDQCLQVSTATHPPCNAGNSCQSMRDEIARGCAALGASAPTFCAPPTTCRAALDAQHVPVCTDLGPTGGCDPSRVVKQGQRWTDEEQDADVDGASFTSADACVQQFSNIATADGCCGG